MCFIDSKGVGSNPTPFVLPASFFTLKLMIMAISPELLEILRCPKCKEKVETTADESGLKCVNPECALVYPIRDDIPVMLVEEATVEK